MPTFHDPVADAEEAFQALRALAHVTASVDDPRQIYAILGSLSAASAAMSQSLHQLAKVHDTGRFHREVDGELREGKGVGAQVSWNLHRAGEGLSGVTGCIDCAHADEGRITYRPVRRDSPDTPRRASSERGFGL